VLVCSKLTSLSTARSLAVILYDNRQQALRLCERSASIFGNVLAKGFIKSIFYKARVQIFEASESCCKDRRLRVSTSDMLMNFRPEVKLFDLLHTLLSQLVYYSKIRPLFMSGYFYD